MTARGIASVPEPAGPKYRSLVEGAGYSILYDHPGMRLGELFRLIDKNVNEEDRRSLGRLAVALIGPLPDRSGSKLLFSDQARSDMELYLDRVVASHGLDLDGAKRLFALYGDYMAWFWHGPYSDFLGPEWEEPIRVAQMIRDNDNEMAVLDALSDPDVDGAEAELIVSSARPAIPQQPRYIYDDMGWEPAGVDVDLAFEPWHECD